MTRHGYHGQVECIFVVQEEADPAYQLLQEMQAERQRQQAQEVRTSRAQSAMFRRCPLTAVPPACSKEGDVNHDDEHLQRVREIERVFDAETAKADKMRRLLGQKGFPPLPSPQGDGQAVSED